MAIGKCISCDKEIFRKVDRKWEDIEYHSITFLHDGGSYIRFPFCKVCHDSWEDVKNEELYPKIEKHVHEMAFMFIQPYLKMKLEKMVTKDGPLDQEEKENITITDAGGLIWR